MHAIVLYYRKENESDLLSTSICFISDDLKHDVNFVYKVMRDTIKCIRDNITEALSKVHYFSDGRYIKNRYRGGELPKKGGLGHYRFKRRAWEERGGGSFMIT